jgi:hypothetical protein
MENKEDRIEMKISKAEKIKAMRAAHAHELTLSQLVRALLRKFYADWESGTVGAFQFEQDSINEAVEAVKTQFKPLTPTPSSRFKMGRR